MFLCHQSEVAAPERDFRIQVRCVSRHEGRAVCRPCATGALRRLSHRTALRVAPGSVARISDGAIVALRIATLFLAVRAQAFEQAPENRLVSRQACCPVGVSLGSELVDPRLPVAAFEGSTTAEGHFSPQVRCPDSTASRQDDPGFAVSNPSRRARRHLDGDLSAGPVALLAVNTSGHPGRGTDYGRGSCPLPRQSPSLCRSLQSRCTRSASLNQTWHPLARGSAPARNPRQASDPALSRSAVSWRPDHGPSAAQPGTGCRDPGGSLLASSRRRWAPDFAS